ncbi:hypothetical protein [Xanthomonas phage RTH11]|nr:hypothetical protein [Xanthomonas phage RTH11]
MSILSLLVMLGREVFPFLKEALLEGQTFRAWFKTNWPTFTWLVSALLMTLMLAYLSDLLVVTQRNEHTFAQQLQPVHQSMERLVKEYKELKVENSRLLIENEQLSTLKTAHEAKLDQYEQWMGTCGVNIESGQCRVVRQPARPAARAKPRTQLPQPQPNIDLPQPEPEKPGFLQRIKRMLSRDKKNEDEP